MTNHRTQFNSVIEQNLERVYRLVVRLVGSSSDADDVAQDVFVEAYRASLANTVKNWPAYLTRLTTHRSLDHLRKRKRLPVILQDEPACYFAHPGAEMEAAELSEWLRTEIAGLPNQQGEVFTLVCIEQHTRDEVADLLNISIESVSTSLYKARKRLEQRLQHWQNGATK